MTRELSLLPLHAGWLAGLLPAHQRFSRGLVPSAERRLRALLRKNRDTAFGRMFRFSSISTFEQYRQRVPVHTYDDLAPYLARARRAEPNVLTAEPIRFFERSGGTSREHTKLIPYTDSMLRELQAATNPWLADLYLRHPRLIGRPAYWSLSPAAQGQRRTEGGLPIGLDDDTDYFDPLRRFVLSRSMAVPASVTRAPDMATWRRETLAHLLACRNLGFVSVWSPTFLIALLDHLRRDPPLDHPALRPHRTRIDRALAGPREGLGSRLWPELSVISCWADGPSAAPAATLKA
ncbi:MAG TPA: GH3 auxin-responsive promoter family protein, partial [Myxococcota bacterium]|nr:GH3 auxin-responsive promoter family protein [Myxococcota bacterium]